jgi:hypothetical protein
MKLRKEEAASLHARIIIIAYLPACNTSGAAGRMLVDEVSLLLHFHKQGGFALLKFICQSKRRAFLECHTLHCRRS